MGGGGGVGHTELASSEGIDDCASLSMETGSGRRLIRNQIFLVYREIQIGAVAKSYMRKGFLIYEEMRKYFPIYEDS